MVKISKQKEGIIKVIKRKEAGRDTASLLPSTPSGERIEIAGLRIEDL
jgi:hypothetical protein